jgi:hypothetical protein
LTFYRSVAPFFGDRCFHRENVPPQLVREVANQLDPTGTSSVQPTVQRGNRSGLPLLLKWFEFGLLENRPEAHHQPSHGGIVWTARECDALAWPTCDGQIWPTWVASSLPHSHPELVKAALAGVKPGDAR